MSDINELNDSLFGSPEESNAKTSSSPLLNSMKKFGENLQTLNNIDELRGKVASGEVSIAIVPKGSKAIIIRQEFNPEVKEKVEALQNELNGVKIISNQDDATKANSILKRAKQLDKTLEEERKFMTSTLDEEKKNIMNYKEGIVNSLSTLINFVNTKITDFQKEELKKQQEKEAELKRFRDEELKKAQIEADRKAAIQKKIIDFENSVLNACLSATLLDVDDKIQKLKSVKLLKDAYEEFLPEAQLMYARCTTRMDARKLELVDLDRIAKINKDEAEKKRLEVEEKNRLESESLKQKSTETLANIEDQKQSEVLNSQVNYEFSKASGAKIKGIQKRWKFDETKIDMALLPDEYKTFDEKKIKEAIALGAREIPGVHIFEDIVNVSR